MSQRAESLAGLLAMATLYATIRGASSQRAAWWYGGAVLAWHVSERQQRQSMPIEEPVVPPGVATVLSVQNGVLKNEQLAEAFGLEKTIGAATFVSGVEWVLRPTR